MHWPFSRGNGRSPIYSRSRTVPQPDPYIYRSSLFPLFLPGFLGISFLLWINIESLFSLTNFFLLPIFTNFFLHINSSLVPRMGLNNSFDGEKNFPLLLLPLLFYNDYFFYNYYFYHSSSIKSPGWDNEELLP
jgi:hypothetical protein